MAENDQQANERQFQIQRIYIKDVSFEAPNAPTIFLENGQPKNELSFNTKVEAHEDDSYEVVLSVTASVKVEEKTAFIVEIQQAGLFGVRGFPKAELGPLLGAYCPNILFPYAREAMTDLVTKGSFPQLVLQPVNFEALYAQHQQQVAEQLKTQASDAAH